MQTTLRNSRENAGFLPQRVILIGGSARAAAESALAAGMRVAAIDLFGDQDLRAVAERWCRWTPAEPLIDPLRNLLAAAPDVPTGIILVGGAESAAEALDDARRQLESSRVRFLIPTAEQLHAATDPACLQSIADRSGILFPTWQTAAPPKPMACQRWLIKPRIRCGGLAVREYLGQPTSDAKSEPEPASYLQRFVPGQLLGVSYCADRERTNCLGVCLGRSGGARSATFRYAGSIGPLPISAAWQTTLQRLGTVIQETLGLRGLFGVDLICDGSRVFLLEVNCRYCASMELLDCEQVNCLAMHCSAFSPSQASAETKLLVDHAEPTFAAVRCKRIVYARHPIVWDASKQHGLESYLRLQAVGSVADSSITCHDLPRLGTVIDADSPLLTMVTSGEAAANVWRRATRESIRLRRLLGA